MYNYEIVIKEDEEISIIITGPDNFKLQLLKHLVTGKVFTEKSANVYAQMYIQRLISEKKEAITLAENAVKDVQQKNIISHYDFRSRFTFAEKVAIQSSTDPGIQVLEKDMMSAPMIDIENKQLNDGMDYYVSKQLLTQERRDKIMSVNIDDDNEILNIIKNTQISNETSATDQETP